MKIRETVKTQRKTILTGQETDVLNSNPGFAFHCPYDFHQLIITLCLSFLICEMRLCLEVRAVREDTQHPEEHFQNGHSTIPSLLVLSLPVDALIYWLTVPVLKLTFSTLQFIYWTVAFRDFQMSVTCWKYQRVNISTTYCFAKFRQWQQTEPLG